LAALIGVGLVALAAWLLISAWTSSDDDRPRVTTTRCQVDVSGAVICETSER